LHLLIGVGCFISLLIDHSRWFAATDRIRALLVVGRDPFQTSAPASDPVSAKRLDDTGLEATAGRLDALNPAELLFA